MAGVISKRVLEDIRFRSDIADVIGSYINLKKAGSSFKALCPFHREKTPSFHVNPQRQIYHCFGCGAGGDVFSFVMQHEGVDFTVAVKMLADRAGIALELEESDDDGTDKTVLFKLLSETALLYHRALLESEKAAAAREYLEKRDIGSATVKEFMIGYAPDMWDAVLNWARKKKYRVEQIEQAGLIVRSSKEGGGRSDFYDRFRNRLMFPILDLQGRAIGFSGRILAADSKSAKYVNSPETALFRKSRVLYAMDKARRHIAEENEALICEGQIDVIRCHQAGIGNAVAAQGTAFTEEQVQVLRRYADSLCIAFDPDKAGQDAAVRAAGVFMEAGLAVRVAVLPEKEDPDLFIRKHGAEAFRALIGEAMSAVGYQITVLSGREDAASEIGAMRIARAVLQTIARSPNAVQRAKLIQEAAERLRLPAGALHDDLRHMLLKARTGGVSSGTESDSAGKPGGGAKVRPKEEVELCEHMVHILDNPGLLELAERYLPLKMLRDDCCRVIVEACLESARSGRTVEEVLRKSDDRSAGLQALAAQVLMAPVKVTEEYTREDAVRDIILRMWRGRLESERSEIRRRRGTKPESGDEERSRQLTFDLNALKNWDEGSTVIEIQRDETSESG